MIVSCMPISEEAKKCLTDLGHALGFDTGLITEMAELSYDDPDKEGIQVHIQLSRKIKRDVGFKKRSKK